MWQEILIDVVVTHSTTTYSLFNTLPQLVPFVNRLSQVLLPLTYALTTLSDRFLSVAGMRSKEETNVNTCV